MDLARRLRDSLARLNPSLPAAELDDAIRKLTTSDGAAVDLFGNSVAVEGDTVVVGAYRDDDHGTDSGSAYLLIKPTSGEWADATETAKLTASDGAAGDDFGYSIAVDGDTVVVGARGDADNGADCGSAYVFTEPATGGEHGHARRATSESSQHSARN